MKRLILTALLALMPSLVCSGEVEDLIAQLGAESFAEREDAQRTLLAQIPGQAKAIQKEALRLYPDPDADPETRIRLLQVLEQLAKETSFEEKNGFIGLTISPGNAFVPKDQGREVVPAVVAMNVMPGLQGEKAGLKQNDQIFEINGKRFDRATGTTIQFMESIGYSAPGENVELTVMRGGKRLDIEVELMKRPGDLPPGYYNADKDFDQFFGKWLEEQTTP